MKSWNNLLDKFSVSTQVRSRPRPDLLDLDHDTHQLQRHHGRPMWCMHTASSDPNVSVLLRDRLQSFLNLLLR